MHSPVIPDAKSIYNSESYQKLAATADIPETIAAQLKPEGWLRMVIAAQISYAASFETSEVTIRILDGDYNHGETPPTIAELKTENATFAGAIRKGIFKIYDLEKMLQAFYKREDVQNTSIEAIKQNTLNAFNELLLSVGKIAFVDRETGITYMTHDATGCEITNRQLYQREWETSPLFQNTANILNTQRVNERAGIAARILDNKGQAFINRTRSCPDTHIFNTPFQINENLHRFVNSGLLKDKDKFTPSQPEAPVTLRLQAAKALAMNQASDTLCKAILKQAEAQNPTPGTIYITHSTQDRASQAFAHELAEKLNHYMEDGASLDFQVTAVAPLVKCPTVSHPLANVLMAGSTPYDSAPFQQCKNNDAILHVGALEDIQAMDQACGNKLMGHIPFTPSPFKTLTVDRETLPLDEETRALLHEIQLSEHTLTDQQYAYLRAAITDGEKPEQQKCAGQAIQAFIKTDIPKPLQDLLNAPAMKSEAIATQISAYHDSLYPSAALGKGR